MCTKSRRGDWNETLPNLNNGTTSSKNKMKHRKNTAEDIKKERLIKLEMGAKAKERGDRRLQAVVPMKSLLLLVWPWCRWWEIATRPASYCCR